MYLTSSVVNAAALGQRLERVEDLTRNNRGSAIRKSRVVNVIVVDQRYFFRISW
jgi:hypothetical protein